MLDFTDEDRQLVESAGNFNEEFDKLTCRLKFGPEDLNLAKQGERLMPIYDDGRSFVRFICHLRGILYYEQHLPAISRQLSAHIVATNNISRSGLSFFHFEQLFPRERFSIWIDGRKPLNIEVTRCYQKAQHCFVIGAMYVRGKAQDTRKQSYLSEC